MIIVFISSASVHRGCVCWINEAVKGKLSDNQNFYLVLVHRQTHPEACLCMFRLEKINEVVQKSGELNFLIVQFRNPSHLFIQFERFHYFLIRHLITVEG